MKAKTSPIAQVISMPPMTAYHLFLSHMARVAAMQRSESSTPGSERFPSVMADVSPGSISPELYRPITTMKKPIPAVMASFIELGMSSIIFFLRPVTEIRKNAIPETSTTARACSNVNPML